MELFATVEDGYVDDIRLWLDLPYSKTDEIKRNYQSPIQMREAYLDLYISDHPCPSWRQVAKALRNLSIFYVGLGHQADEVERTYVQGSIIYRYSYCLSS